jgi:hypothetical protein
MEPVRERGVSEEDVKKIARDRNAAETLKDYLQFTQLINRQ